MAFCEVCMISNHRHCVGMNIDDYLNWGQIEEGWACPKCSREAFPFWDVSSLDSSVNTTYSGSAADSAFSDTQLPPILLLTLFQFQFPLVLPLSQFSPSMQEAGSQTLMSLELCAPTIPMTVSQKPGFPLTFWNMKIYQPGYSIMCRDHSCHAWWESCHLHFK